MITMKDIDREEHDQFLTELDEQANLQIPPSNPAAARYRSMCHLCLRYVERKDICRCGHYKERIVCHHHRECHRPAVVASYLPLAGEEGPGMSLDHIAYDMGITMRAVRTAVTRINTVFGLIVARKKWVNLQTFWIRDLGTHTRKTAKRLTDNVMRESDD